MKAFSSFMENVQGPKVRERSPSFADHFSQATLFWNSMAPWEKAHIVFAFSFELNMVDTEAVRERVVNELLINVAPELAARVSKQTGIRLTAKPKTNAHHDASPALSMDKPCADIKGRKIAVLAGAGVDGRYGQRASETARGGGRWRRNYRQKPRDHRWKRRNRVCRR